jgi:hypothetical protein
MTWNNPWITSPKKFMKNNLNFFLNDWNFKIYSLEAMLKIDSKEHKFELEFSNTWKWIKLQHHVDSKKRVKEIQ